MSGISEFVQELTELAGRDMQAAYEQLLAARPEYMLRVLMALANTPGDLQIASLFLTRVLPNAFRKMEALIPQIVEATGRQVSAAQQKLAEQEAIVKDSFNSATRAQSEKAPYAQDLVLIYFVQIAIREKRKKILSGFTQLNEQARRINDLIREEADRRQAL